MNLIERLIIEANKEVFKMARENGNLTSVILEILSENTKEKIDYLLKYQIATTEEIQNALKEINY